METALFPLSLGAKPRDLLDLWCLPHIQLAVLQAPQQSRHPERSASQLCRITKGFIARSRRTPAMLPGGCSRELSGRKLQREVKRSQTPSEADLSRRAVEGSAFPFPHNEYSGPRPRPRLNYPPA